VSLDEPMQAVDVVAGRTSTGRKSSQRT